MTSEQATNNTSAADPHRRLLWTVGAGTLPAGQLQVLLGQADITDLVDVRSVPASRWATWHNQPQLQQATRQAGRTYRWAGKLLGGRWPDHTPAGHTRPDYRQVSATEQFQTGIRRLLQLIDDPTRRIAVLCAEENPTSCHRRLLIGRHLTNPAWHHNHHQLDTRPVTLRHLRHRQPHLQTDDALEENSGQQTLDL